jgi:hypothetical protein
MSAILTIVALAVVWFVCSLINLTWLKHYPNVMAIEFRPALILIAPLATFFVVLGPIGVWRYNIPLRLMNVRKDCF